MEWSADKNDRNKTRPNLEGRLDSSGNQVSRAHYRSLALAYVKTNTSTDYWVAMTAQIMSLHTQQVSSQGEGGTITVNLESFTNWQPLQLPPQTHQ